MRWGTKSTFFQANIRSLIFVAKPWHDLPWLLVCSEADVMSLLT